MSEMEQLYQQVILDHARRREGSGSLDGLEGTSHQVSPTCGDEVTLGVNLDCDGRVAKLAWDGDGCSISQASLSVMSEMVVGMDASDREALAEKFLELMHSRGATDLTEDDLDLLDDAAAFQGVSKFPARVKCALLGWMALKDAVEQAEK